MSNLRTLIWVTVRLVSEEAMDVHLGGRFTTGSPLAFNLRSVTLELEWPHALPERGQQWCITDLARTELESVEWWPTEEPPCRVLHMADVYVTSEAEYAEVVDGLTRVGAKNAYAT